MYLIPLNSTLKNGEDGKYIMRILTKEKKKNKKTRKLFTFAMKDFIQM